MGEIRDGHIMLQILPIMLCSSAPILYPLCLHISPIMLQLCFTKSGVWALNSSPYAFNTKVSDYSVVFDTH